jgi:hypothetical protein
MVFFRKEAGMEPKPPISLAALVELVRPYDIPDYCVRDSANDGSLPTVNSGQMVEQEVADKILDDLQKTMSSKAVANALGVTIPTVGNLVLGDRPKIESIKVLGRRRLFTTSVKNYNEGRAARPLMRRVGPKKGKKRPKDYIQTFEHPVHARTKQERLELIRTISEHHKSVLEERQKSAWDPDRARDSGNEEEFSGYGEGDVSRLLGSSFVR